ncbi:MAG: CmpA/NrtA family ABC transporter substrate-binding protein [Porticoccaceae bacterium]
MNIEISKNLPTAELDHLNLGYMRLTDSAPLIVAQDIGLYEKFGLNVSLHREVSWANIRDKTIAGTFDACQMLAPMPLVTTMGAAGIRAPMITGLVLSLNGNGVTVSSSLWSKMNESANPDQPLNDALATAQSLRAVLDKTQGGALTFATVHSFSSHTLLLRKWLVAGGIDPDTEVRIIVLPPEQMVDSLAQGVIDGFCVGAPWNTIAVEYGVGIMATTGYEIWNNAPEKVLGVLESWHSRNPSTHLRLRLAMMAACEWLTDMDNRKAAVEILSRPEYLDLPADYLRPSMTGEIIHDRSKAAQSQSNFHVFSSFQAGFPWRSQAESMLEQFTPLLGKPVDSDKLASLAQQCFRSDLYREAATRAGLNYPEQDSKPEGIHAEPWMLNDKIELGSDLMVSPDAPTRNK